MVCEKKKNMELEGHSILFAVATAAAATRRVTRGKWAVDELVASIPVCVRMCAFRWDDLP